jgi:hypothetical protein
MPALAYKMHVHALEVNYEYIIMEGGKELEINKALCDLK